MNSGRFITAFNRDRDGYQVALALHEGGLLERLVTDIYLPDWLVGTAPAKWSGLGHRHVHGLPSAKVVSCPRAVWLQTLPKKFCRNQAEELKLFAQLDGDLSRKSLAVAAASGASFFTYSGYALEAFQAPSMRDRRKILFVYHPPSSGFMGILQEDLAAHPEVSWSYALHKHEMANADGDRLEREIELADEVVCASSFTKHAIRMTNPTVPVSVVPYGCDILDVTAPHKPSRRDGKPRVLFVGQGVQRKGLHHLLKAWRRLRAENAELLLVCSKVDPGILQMVSSAGGSVQLVSGLGRTELRQVFAYADVFVMPSLAEGFGLVFLEALSAGCFCIGTPNTGLPDLHLPPHAGEVLACGDVDALEAALRQVLRLAVDQQIESEAIHEEAKRRSWPVFRESILAIAKASAVAQNDVVVS